MSRMARGCEVHVELEDSRFLLFIQRASCKVEVKNLGVRPCVFPRWLRSFEPLAPSQAGIGHWSLPLAQPSFPPTR